MNKSVIIPIALVLFWAGFVCSISFMEAWLKFRAQGVTLPIGLSIGSKVFTALNRVEWVFFILFTVSVLWQFKFQSVIILTITLLLPGILLIQAFLFLPQLIERATNIINGKAVGKSIVHLCYIFAEVLKVSGLIYLGISYEK